MCVYIPVAVCIRICVYVIKPTYLRVCVGVYVCVYVCVHNLHLLPTHPGNTITSEMTPERWTDLLTSSKGKPEREHMVVHYYMPGESSLCVCVYDTHTRGALRTHAQTRRHAHSCCFMLSPSLSRLPCTMYVCVYVHVLIIHVYVCMCVRVYVGVCVRVHVCVYMCMCVCAIQRKRVVDTWVRMTICWSNSLPVRPWLLSPWCMTGEALYVCVYVWACMHVRQRIPVYVRVYGSHTHTHTDTH